MTECMQKALGRMAVTTAAVLLLGLAFTAPATAAPARGAPAAAVVAASAPQTTPAARAPAPVTAAVHLAVATPAAAEVDFWAGIWAFLQQLWAWLFPPAPPAEQLPLPYNGPANQVVTVDAPNPGSSTATVRAWNRAGNGWSPATGAIPAMVGSQGIGQASEWNSRTPAGAYTLTQAFGRQANPGTRLPYFQTGTWDWWNSNVNSPGYNTHVIQPGSPGGDSENLFNAGPIYDYAVNIDYNTARVPGAGSAFFLHVSNGQPTAGCVAIPVGDLTTIMRWLDPNQQPAIVIGAH